MNGTMILQKHIPNKPFFAYGLVQPEMTPNPVRGAVIR